MERSDLSTDQRRELDVKKLTLEIRLKPPGKPFAEFMLKQWKLQRQFYDEFGGGRILWQQAGVEAFDAMRTWLETEEKNGRFTISDPGLRITFYEYWTTMDHDAFLTADKQRIRETFLEPEWAR